MKVLALVAFLDAARPPAGAQAATIMLAHGIPDTDVDVVVDGDIVIPNYCSVRWRTCPPSGQTLPNLTVNLAGTDTVALDLGDFAAPASGNYTGR